MKDFDLDTSKLDALGGDDASEQDARAEAERCAKFATTAWFIQQTITAAYGSVDEFAEEARRYVKAARWRRALRRWLDSIVAPLAGWVCVAAIAATMIAIAWKAWGWAIGG